MEKAAYIISALCLLAALCEQLLDQSRLLPCVRMLIGLEALVVLISMLSAFAGAISHLGGKT